MTTEDAIIKYNGEVKIYNIAEYVCPVHGNIGMQVIQSTLPNLDCSLCMHCYVEKLIELGVQKAELKDG